MRTRTSRMVIKGVFPIDIVMEKVAGQVTTFDIPSVTKLAQGKRNPFQVLVATILSSRTKDTTTFEASQRLFKRVSSPKELAELSEQTLAELIFPVGFYRVKARHLHRLGPDLEKRFGGCVPASMEELLTLPGVGRKTANLVLSLAFGIDAICVDTHVHRITNRWKYIESSSPEETEQLLRDKLPRRFWITINTVLVAFGQNICLPRFPRCNCCHVNDLCPKEGINKNA